MGQDDRDNSRWSGPIQAVAAVAVAAAGMTLCTLPVLAQHMSGTTGHTSPGHVATTRPMTSGRAVGTPTRGGQRIGTIHANTLGPNSSAPPPSFELPRTVTPHWEISPNLRVNPNSVQGNPIRRQGGGFGVGYVGLPYYVDPMAFTNAADDHEDAIAQQAQPDAPARPDYQPQEPYAEGSGAPYPDRGFPPPRAPYYPEGYPLPPQGNPTAQSAASEGDGLDHPAVTLVFNDGRPPLQVHSYVLTGSSVFVAESGHQRRIPLTDLDLPATIAQNREAGVDFELPRGK